VTNLATFDYRPVLDGRLVRPGIWDELVRETLVPRWLDDYRTMTTWDGEVVEIELDELVYLFDLAPSSGVDVLDAEDRVVAVWGLSHRPSSGRDRSRLQGFLPGSERWSRAGRDRGHLVAHAAGGGLDLNLIPQTASLNRGQSADGRLWRRMERHAEANEGTPLFVRPIYSDASWTPADLELGLLVENTVWWHRFANRRPDPSDAPRRPAS
jgi:hypothetical protein